MYCTKCGVQLEQTARYCSQCGTVTGQFPETPRAATSALMLSRYDRKIAGVCGGVARYLDANSTFVRIIWLTLAIALFPVGVIGYLIAWIVMPKEPARIGAALGTEELRTTV